MSRAESLARAPSDFSAVVRFIANSPMPLRESAEAGPVQM